MYKKYCISCMKEIADDSFVCSDCEEKQETYEVYVHHLKPGTILNDRYLVGNVIGEGGFGITYIGQDLNLDIRIAIKEYFPNGYTNRNNTFSPSVTFSVRTKKVFFDQGKSKFLEEARILAKFSNEQGIVNVRDFFQANNTAYMVMEYLDGVTLKQFLDQKGTLQPDFIIDKVLPLINSLKQVHAEGLIHRDISPDNIMILNDNRLKLLDFGAARYYLSNTDMKTLSVILKPGYAPEEQYRIRGELGPWTDIYALCATIYKCITGITPDDATQRAYNDELKAPSELGVLIAPIYEAAIIKGLNKLRINRFQNMSELHNALIPKEEKKEIPVVDTSKDIEIENEIEVEKALPVDIELDVPEVVQEAVQAVEAVTEEIDVETLPVDNVISVNVKQNKHFSIILIASIIILLAIVFIIVWNINSGTDNNTKPTNSTSAATTANISSPDEII